MCLSHPGWLVADLGQEPRPNGSRVHCGSLNEVGARLCPSDPVTSTPQTFLVTFPERLTQPAPESSRRICRQRDAPRPTQIRQI
jgi:hypothetical protein